MRSACSFEKPICVKRSIPAPSRTPSPLIDIGQDHDEAEERDEHEELEKCRFVTAIPSDWATSTCVTTRRNCTAMASSGEPDEQHAQAPVLPEMAEYRVEAPPEPPDRYLPEEPPHAAREALVHDEREHRRDASGEYDDIEMQIVEPLSREKNERSGEREHAEPRDPDDAVEHRDGEDLVRIVSHAGHVVDLHHVPADARGQEIVEEHARRNRP